MLLMLLVLLPVSDLLLPGGEARAGELTGEELGLGRDFAFAVPALLAVDDAAVDEEVLLVVGCDDVFPAADAADAAAEEEGA